MAEKREKQLVVGILAHVDSGKTTLSEAMLYRAGSIRKLGRVDNKDAFLDTDTLEKARGITIFSKQALLKTGDTSITLLDTPGHVDFSTETERTLQVLDYAVLVISGTDGVQSHTETLWHLLRRYHIPTFVFINKMDLPGPGKEALLRQLSRRLGDGFVDFGAPQAQRDEALALCDERLMETMLDAGSLTAEDIIPAVARLPLLVRRGPPKGERRRPAGRGRAAGRPRRVYPRRPGAGSLRSAGVQGLAG